MWVHRGGVSVHVCRAHPCERAHTCLYVCAGRLHVGDHFCATRCPRCPAMWAGAHAPTQVSLPHCPRVLPLGGKGKRCSMGRAQHPEAANVARCWAERWDSAPSGTCWHPVAPQKVRHSPTSTRTLFIPLASCLVPSVTVVMAAGPVGAQGGDCVGAAPA